MPRERKDSAPSPDAAPLPLPDAAAAGRMSTPKPAMGLARPRVFARREVAVVEVEAIDERMGQCACGRKKDAAAEVEGISLPPPGQTPKEWMLPPGFDFEPKNWT
jgi:hypothetical protein